MPTQPSKDLERIPNPKPERDYEIEITTNEFTCVCPRTGQPDFATITIRYVPDQWIVELKSLKLYFWSFRNEGHYHEEVTNTILDDLVRTLEPRRMTVVVDFNIRGGLHTIVTARYERTQERAEATE